MTKHKDEAEFQKKLEEQETAINDYTNLLKRLQADFENYIKRAEKEKEEFTIYSTHKLVGKLLTIMDDFEKALNVAKQNDGEISKGLEMIYKQMKKTLDEEGVKSIVTIGQKFDPFKHEVVDIVHGEHDEIIVDEIQKGYMLKEKVIRPSKVRISKILEVKRNES